MPSTKRDRLQVSLYEWTTARGNVTYCKQHGVTVAKEFREVESGTKSDRAVLGQAIAYAKRTRSKLVIGKLDRLARSVHFISGLMEAGIDFAACDVPEANRLLLHIMASVAEAEAKAISERTIAALTAAKARGTKLGASNPKSQNLTASDMKRGRKLAAKAITAKAKAFYADVLPTISELRAEGMSLADIAAELTTKVSGREMVPNGALCKFLARWLRQNSPQHLAPLKGAAMPRYGHSKGSQMRAFSWAGAGSNLERKGRRNARTSLRSVRSPSVIRWFLPCLGARV